METGGNWTAGQSTAGDVRRLLSFVRPYWRRLALVLALTLASTGVSLFVPYLYRGLVDNALIGRDTVELVRIFSLLLALTPATHVRNVVRGLPYPNTSADLRTV